MRNNLSYSADFLKQNNYDFFLCALFAPAQNREFVFALLAFTTELSLVAEKTSEVMTGLLRFQWWQDAIEEIYLGKPVRSHPVLVPLKEAIVARELSKANFLELIKAFEVDLERKPFENEEAILGYSRCTYGNAIGIVYAILGGAASGNLAQNIGALWGVTHLLAENTPLEFPADNLKSHMNGLVQAIQKDVNNSPHFLRKIFALSLSQKRRIERLKFNLTDGKVRLLPFYKLVVVFF